MFYRNGGEDLNVYNYLDEIGPAEDRAVALGFFDGVHRGHQAVIQKALDCRAKGMRPAVFTYRIQHNIPERKSSFLWINSEEERVRMMEELGVLDLVQPTFEDFCDMSPEEFVEDFLIKRMRAKVIVCGQDFRFGRKAAGNVETMKELCKSYGVRVVIVPPVVLDGDRISSTRIRGYITKGNMYMAWRMLGRPYSLRFPVVSGNKIGRTLNFPTINQVYPDHFAIPRFGVYVSVTEVDGEYYPSVSNVGVKPTVGSDRPLSETYIIGFSGNLYGTRVRVSLCHFIRPEIKFASLDELRMQIAKDTLQATYMGPSFVLRMKEQRHLL